MRVRFLSPSGGVHAFAGLEVIEGFAAGVPKIGTATATLASSARDPNGMLTC
jgi:hypothetical protein